MSLSNHGRAPFDRLRVSGPLAGVKGEGQVDLRQRGTGYSARRACDYAGIIRRPAQPAGGMTAMTQGKRYRLLGALYAPAESTEPDKYMADTPAFPNCVAWGDTPEETIDILESVVAATIRTYEERGYALPPGVERAQVN